jgi:heat-inducible transcriptional repressor
MQMDQRKQQILRVVVRKYVATAEPVSSDYISSSSGLGVKSATVRNEMAAMSEMGYLLQPHTSAGRIPSDLGYRYYVDRLMPSDPQAIRQLPDVETGLMREHTAVDDLIAATCRMLSAVTHLTALATTPLASGIKLKYLDLQEMSGGRVLALSVWSNGQARQAVLEAPVAGGLLAQVRKMVCAAYLNRTSEDILGGACQAQFQPGPASVLGGRVREFLEHAARDVSLPEVIVDGTGYFVRQPEFREQPGLELVLSVLEDERTMGQLLLAAGAGEKPQVVIGGENPIEVMRSCSLVAASYGSWSGVRGSIGVCGPTRMDYDRSVSAVGLAARALSSALDALLPA